MVQRILEFCAGTGWFKNGEANLRDAERIKCNIMKAMRMIDGELAADGPLCTLYNAGVMLWKPKVDGLVIRQKRFGELVKAGEVSGELLDPYTGQLLGMIPNTEAALVIPSGREWPTIGDLDRHAGNGGSCRGLAHCR